MCFNKFSRQLCLRTTVLGISSKADVKEIEFLNYHLKQPSNRNHLVGNYMKEILSILFEPLYF